eukprot:s666_g13.t1
MKAGRKKWRAQLQPTAKRAGLDDAQDDIFNATLTRKPPLDMMPPQLSDLSDLLAAMLTKDVTQRPTASQVLGKEWFDSVATPSKKTRTKELWALIGQEQQWPKGDRANAPHQCLGFCTTYFDVKFPAQVPSRVEK